MENTKLNEAPKSVTPLRYLKGIGPRRAEALEKLGIHSLHDLFFFFPRRHEDRTQFVKIGEVTPSANVVTIHGEVLTLGIRPIRRNPIFEMVVGDETGLIPAVWFNQPYLKNQFKVGTKVILSGRADLYQDRLQMNSPEYEIIESEEEDTVHSGRIVPVYPLTEGLYQRSLRATMKDLIDHHLESQAQETLSENIRQSYHLMPLPEALREMHFPSDFEKLARARRRMIFEEFFQFQKELQEKLKTEREKINSISLAANEKQIEAFSRSLPFALTGDQKRAVQEIQKDLSRSFAMNRLLQGEVGSGKTLVAAFACFVAAKAGHQTAFLIPTEILAEQHSRTLEKFLTPLGVRTGLLTASTGPNERLKMLAQLKSGELAVLVGTHALLQETVQFHSLALVVVDEQHKFGVRQRGQLLQATPRPHQLVMTATPIPRTLALTVYGDLEISIMKELPKGRQPVNTYWIIREKQPEVLQHIRERVLAGEQAYLVFPLIEETEKADLFAAKKEYDRLLREDFKDLKLGLVHGRLDREERERIMQSFREGKLQILVATSVIEVGVDNPNATLMVIENAERFGLSQLHQLRGRVGRGTLRSDCFLFGEPKTEEGKRRLRSLTKTNDGFIIAEEDLRLRGPGELLGVRQSGDPYFRVADLSVDIDILLEARQAALRLIS